MNSRVGTTPERRPTSRGTLQQSAIWLNHQHDRINPPACATSVPDSLVLAFAVTVVSVVATGLVPVVAPARIPGLSRAAVIIRERRGLSFGDGSRSQASKPWTGAHYDR